MNPVPDLTWSSQTIASSCVTNYKLSPKKTIYTADAYAPIVDAKPADMATVYTSVM
ncbi:hypothetical protein LSAT2_014565, partial [Lamellibrachia satsuma]